MTQVKRAYNRRDAGQTRSEILEIIRTIPDCTAKEIASLMPHVKATTVISAIHVAKLEGVIQINGSKPVPIGNGVVRSAATYGLSDNPTPRSEEHTSELQSH